MRLASVSQLPPAYVLASTSLLMWASMSQLYVSESTSLLMYVLASTSLLMWASMLQLLPMYVSRSTSLLV